MSGDIVKFNGNIVTVGEQGADFSNPVDAIGSILDASDEKRYQVLIASGEYRLTSPLRLKEYVDVIGKS